jgi:hypothetical protein
MANKPGDFPQFTEIDKADIDSLCAKFSVYLDDFSKKMGIWDIDCAKPAILQIFNRIEKRRVYFHIFYNDCVMGELNESALMCFWIIKLQPFFTNNIPANELNAKIALHLFSKTIFFVASKTGKQPHLTGKLLEDLYYSFRFRDISKEALMLLAESLVQ